MLYQLCVISGADNYGEYINGKKNQADCSLNHPLCAECMFGLWRIPSACAVGDTHVHGQRIQFSRGIVNCPLCSLDAIYVSCKTGEPIRYKRRSVIHGVLKWKNHYTMEDTMCCYIAGTGMDDVWKGICLFQSDERLRPRARKLVEMELTKMFRDRTFNCNVCREDKPVMEQFAYTNGISNSIVTNGVTKEFM